MAKTFKINGNDYTRYFTHRNWTLGYQPVAGDNAGRLLNGTIFEDEIKQNAVITISLMPLTEAQAAKILNDVLSTVSPVLYYFDLRAGKYREIKTTRQVSPFTYWGECVGGDYYGGSVITFAENDEDGGY